MKKMSEPIKMCAARRDADSWCTILLVPHHIGRGNCALFVICTHALIVKHVLGYEKEQNLLRTHPIGTKLKWNRVRYSRGGTKDPT